MSGPAKDPDSPATTSFAWDSMIEVWDMVDTLLQGTAAMRAAGPMYLPQHDEESNDNYNERLMTNVLTNKLEQTLDNFVGRPFSDDVRMNDDVPDGIRDLASNIDLQGNNLTVFCREWFREGLAKGFAHVLIDFPRMDETERGTRTLADDFAEGRRPYWVLVKPENLIFAAADIVETADGVKEFLTHVRIKEVVTEQVGFTEVAHEQIRVLEPGFFQLWRKVVAKGKRKPEWVIIDQGETGLNSVPLVTFYADRKGLMMAKPPLEDLAHMNIRHWQSMSDQINVLTVARFPMLAVAGATDSAGSVMRIGPRQLLGTKDPNGKFYYVEHSGKSIEAGRTELQDLEDQMGTYGAAFLKRKSGDQTATARALDSAESVSVLQDMTLRFIDSVNNAFSITAQWLGLPEGGTVTITTDFGPEELNDTDATTLSRARDKREISRVTFIDELKRRGILDEEYDAETDMEVILQEIEDNEALLPFQVPPGVFDPSEDGGIGNGSGGETEESETQE
jgi:hypothetical protein